MKKNNKGFMLAELIIVSTVVVVGMVGMYTNYSKVYSLYKERYNYYSVDGIYATKEMVRYLVNSNFNQVINQFEDTSHSIYLVQDNRCNDSIVNDVCPSIQKLYQVKNMILMEYHHEALESLNVDDLFKDYITYVIRYYGIEKGSEEEQYSYIVLTEIEMDGNRYYSNLRIR